MKKRFFQQTFLLVILFALLFLSCGQNQTSNKSISPENISFKIAQVSIDTFSTFPPEIDGCTCYFSNDEKEFKNRKYIYADDYGNNAFVSINGVMTKFILTKSQTLPNKRYVKTFVNDNYEISIDVKQIGQIDETWQQKGTMKIQPKSGEEIIRKIYGECGC